MASRLYAADRGMPIPSRGDGWDSLNKVQPAGRYLRAQERQSNLGSHPALHLTFAELMEPLAGFEPATLSLRMRCSTN